MRQRLIQLMPSSDEDEGVHSASGAATASATSSREREGEAAAPAAPPSPELAALLRANALLPGGADEVRAHSACFSPTRHASSSFNTAPPPPPLCPAAQVAAVAWGLPQARPKQRGAALSYLRSTYLGRTLSSLGRDPADEERYRALVQDRPPAFDAAGVVRLANMAGEGERVGRDGRESRLQLHICT